MIWRSFLTRFFPAKGAMWPRLTGGREVNPCAVCFCFCVANAEPSCFGVATAEPSFLLFFVFCAFFFYCVFFSMALLTFGTVGFFLALRAPAFFIPASKASIFDHIWMTPGGCEELLPTGTKTSSSEPPGHARQVLEASSSGPPGPVRHV